MSEFYLKGSSYIKTVEINGVKYGIMLSKHAEGRIKKRKINEGNVVKIIQSFFSRNGRTLKQMKNGDLDVMIINIRKNYSIVVRRNGNCIVIVTVIDKTTDLFIKPDIKTKIFIIK